MSWLVTAQSKGHCSLVHHSNKDILHWTRKWENLLVKWFINYFRKNWHPFFLPSEIFTTPPFPSCGIHNECSLKGTQIPESVTFLLAESGIRKFLLVESGILGFGIWKSAEGVRNPTNSLLIYGAIWEKTVPGVSLFKKNPYKWNLHVYYCFSSENNGYTGKLHL